ncbi:cilia- and flagella-associated protein 77 [Catharus ustulatus]|uniref:cilia- and flagella-associated protein 77 n=1 Tax=Catharus ustulatus TaxID=91951 RepID=UPI00140799EE|nr:cilia- and flagella-associated protein 77 [Catharus ustulatus]
MAGGRAGSRRRLPMSLAEAGPGTENERLGLVRLSMLRNPLIIKPELGKPMRNCYPLPGFDFTYGMYMHKRDGGVPEAIGHWDSVKVKAKPHKRVMPRDFVTMGRGAVDEGCTTAREFALYYNYMDTRCKDKNILRYGGKVPPDMTFGRPSRPPTPIYDILQHRYRELWMESQRARTVVQHTPVKKKVGEVRENRTTFLRMHPLPVKEESFWHPQRFEKAEPHLRTFPDPESRKKALSASH